MIDTEAIANVIRRWTQGRQLTQWTLSGGRRQILNSDIDAIAADIADALNSTNATKGKVGVDARRDIGSTSRVQESQVEAVLDRAETAYAWCCRGAEDLPPLSVREHFNYDVPELLTAVKRLTAELARSERDETRAITDRDDNHEIADKLAEAIARLTGKEIGEHSSANDPWQNALEAAARVPTTGEVA